MKIRHIVIVLIVLLLLGSNTFAEVKNLASDPGFENESSDTVWIKDPWDKTPGVTEFLIDNNEKHTGQSSYLIYNHSINDARIEQNIKVKGNAKYRISCWIKTEDVGLDKKGANISIKGIRDISRDLRDTNNFWEYVELYGYTGQNQDQIVVTLGLGSQGSLNTGKVWFDDLCIEEIDSVPSDRKAVPFYKVKSKHEFNGIEPIWIIAAIFTLSFLISIIYIIRKSKNNRVIHTLDHDLEASSALISPIRRPFLDRRDIVIMLTMTMVYFGIAVYHLGSSQVPQTSWKPASAGESFTIELGRMAELSRIYYYSGYGRGKFKVQYWDDKGGYTNLVSIDKKDLFIWKYVNTKVVKTHKLKVIVDSAGFTLNELGFYESEKNKPIEGIKVVEAYLQPKDEGKVENLFDEQTLIEYRPTYMTGTYFDEIYYTRTAYEHLNRMEPYEYTHPPLGKLFIAFGMTIFGTSPFGWRIVGTLFGVLMIPVMYAFGKKLFSKRLYAFCAAFLLMFDFMHFTQTRIATIDSYAILFIILMYYYMYDVFMGKSYEKGFLKYIKPLFLSGLFFGLGVASKWIALYGGVGLAVLLFYSKYAEIKEFIKIKRQKEHLEGNHWVNKFIKYNIVATGIACCIFFVLIPGIIYILSYIPFFMVPGPGHQLKDLWSYQLSMFKYHHNLVAEHPYQASWWTWPLNIITICYYIGNDALEGMSANITAMGNPLIWWYGILCIIVALILAIKKRDKKMTVIFTAITFQYIPWIFIKRILFIYHYFSVTPFMILAMVYVIKHLIENFPKTRYLIYLYLASAAMVFIIFYPVLSGMEVSTNYFDYLRWLPSWPF